MGFLKKGKEAAALMEQAELKQQQQNSPKAFRFWMPENATTSITFLDGDLTEDGVLDVPRFMEHQVYLNGSYKNWFACTEGVDTSEPCPLCQGGDNPYTAGVMTIIDHSEWKDKKGIIHKDERKLLVAKFNSLKYLNQLALKRKGLAGCTFDVSRIGAKSASIGSAFDFTEKQSLEVLKKKYGDDATVFDYEDALPYLSPKELKALGFGVNAIGGNTDPFDADVGQTEGGAGYEDVL